MLAKDFMDTRFHVLPPQQSVAEAVSWPCLIRPDFVPSRAGPV
jgi:hypothetical protein